MSAANETPPCTLEHPVIVDKKPTKEVSEFYKKQNELLENFKADNEQIQSSLQTRTRQRGASTNSEEREQQPAAIAAPILQQYDDGDVTVRRDKATSGGKQTTDQQLEEGRLLGEKKVEGCQSRAASWLSRATLVINVTLMFMKAAAAYWTLSLSIVSSFVDSLVDITSGGAHSILNEDHSQSQPLLVPSRSHAPRTHDAGDHLGRHGLRFTATHDGVDQAHRLGRSRDSMPTPRFAY
ncbi:hypothetical protein PMAYCL1PPCAC_14792 [Pristionchus mayeri]|uniref:Uncharacterized protein n=1 Tax=Pristionchus mayeri TaxID=1317129 RepID=A0AAN5CHN8_9BILA|nr:hypothetical protein PMAYCL1PPCAC_14792 [Pristionchus mayeri]